MTKLEAQDYVGYFGEITGCSDRACIRIHDGVKPGGFLVEDENTLYIHEILSQLESTHYTRELVDQMLSGEINLFTNNIDPMKVTRKNSDDGEFGWVDLQSDITVRGQGVNSPTWSQFRSGIYAYDFEAGKTQECWSNFHIDHDYAMGTPVYPHIHWSPKTTGIGTVRWGFEYTVAKGHSQASGSVFGPTSIVYAETVITQDSQYTHFVTETSEVSAIPPSNLEPDSLVLMRFFRDASNDTYPGSVAAFKVDLHYQAARFSTKNRAPDFFNGWEGLES
ncbi:MAG: hypothetical protein IBX57_00740 [Gammaproteobacteria bacterium]|nr:hypothetical protein [Gammaproteobacteria bacterium]